MIKIIGKTPDNKSVIKGLFHIYETEGIPLDLILQSTKDNDLVPCWISFYLEAKSSGMSHDRIINKLEPAIIDSFGLFWASQVIDTLNNLYNQRKL